MTSPAERSPEELVRLDRELVWHPFTQMQEYSSYETLVIEKGRGNYLYDLQGRKYLDGVSSLWCNLLGHRKRAIDRAIRTQLQHMAHSTLLGLSHVSAIRLAEKLVEITPANLSHVFFSDNGSTAVEVALKMAFQYWQQVEGAGSSSRNRFLTLREGYHGDTVGSVSLGGIDLFQEIYRPLLFPTYKAHAPYCYRCPLGLQPESCQMECAEDLESLLRRHRSRIAAVVLEPRVLAAAGMLVQPAGYLKRIAEACKKYGVFLILDEVATGFGRTGSLFACEAEGVEPDFLCLSKGLTGGYLPLGATLTTERVFQGFWGSYRAYRTFFHGHTYTGNPLACSAALATIECLQKERIIEKLERKIDYFQKQLRKLQQLATVGEIRQVGLMVGIELVSHRETKEPYPPEERRGHRVCLEARRRGVLIRPLGDVIVLMPPLSVTRPQIDWLVEAVHESILSVAKCALP